MSHRSAHSLAAGRHQSAHVLVILGLVSWLVYAGVAWLSQRFTLNTPGIDRPIVAVLLLLCTAFAVYLWALWTAVRATDDAKVSAIVLGFAVAFRLQLLFTQPIQEVDIYRYLWDGQVSRYRVDPYQFSPQQVLQADRSDQIGAHTASRELTNKDHGGTSASSDLQRLIELRDSSPAIQEILSRVHYAELPTVYPPVSQAVFMLAAQTTANGADVSTHVLVMKAWIILFDVATILVLMALLKLTAKPAGWSLAYAWCPLVLKEFANSGHLDAIAVCLTTLAVYIAVRSGACTQPPSLPDAHNSRSSILPILGAFLVLSLAVGAKLYPVVLAPLLTVFAARRCGWRKAVGALAVFASVSAIVCWPMLGGESVDSTTVTSSIDVTDAQASPPLPPTANEMIATEQDPRAGLYAFLSRWKMNDFLFLIVIENVSPDRNDLAEQQPWFVVTPNTWRIGLTQNIADSIPVPLNRNQIPFIAARTMTAMVFVFLTGWFCWRAWQDNNATRLLEAAFLTLAWFFLLLPTQNPWYWTWALVFVPFARGRAWLAVSGFVLAYYLRFWLTYHWPDSAVAPSAYRGDFFFDYVVTWIEFGPWFVWLAYSTIRRNVTVHTDQSS